jgi:hypothetical protein
MTKLYPIGTQLITRRLSQAALAYELDFWPETEAWGKFYFGFDVGMDNADRPYNTWRVTVTEDNQKWLSPDPIVGDYYTKQNVFSDYILYEKFGDFDREIGAWCGGGIEAKEQIIKRLYPNGQRAPLIEWDEVILPNTKGE